MGACEFCVSIPVSVKTDPETIPFSVLVPSLSPIVDLALDETDLSPGLSVSGSCFESIPGDGKGIVAVR